MGLNEVVSYRFPMLWNVEKTETHLDWKPQRSVSFFPHTGRGPSSGTYHTWLLIRDFFLFSFQVFIEKQKGEILGVVIVESGWGSILPTVIIANMMHGGPAEKSGKLNIGDQIMSINGTSLVGLPLSTCQSIIKVPRREKTPQ